jgi:AraC-like DNA-binding protein
MQTFANHARPDASVAMDRPSCSANIAQLSRGLIAPFVLAAARSGCCLPEALAHVGLPVSSLDESDARVSHALLERVLRSALRDNGIPGFGLLAAEQSRPEHLDVVEYLARVQPTLRGALDVVVRFAALLHDTFEVELEVLGDRALLRVGFGDIAAPPCAHEFVLAALLMAARRMTGLPGLAIVGAQFIHEPPEDMTLHRRLFGSGLAFERQETALLLPRTLLELPLVAADAGLANLLEKHAAARMSSLKRGMSLPDRVREILRQQLGNGRITADDLAAQLGMSSRTLQRRLAADGGNGFARVLESVQREVAVRALGDSRLSVRQVSRLAGFATGQAFHRAFRRWTGSTPSEFREASPRGERASSTPRTAMVG